MNALLNCCNCGSPTYSLDTLIDYPDLSCPVCRQNIIHPLEKQAFKISKPEKTVAKGIDVLCGCGRHMISPNDDDSIQYRERWWKLKCVFLKVDKRMPRILRRMEKMEKEIERHRKMRLKFIRMKKYIRQVPCNYCGEQVGNRFKQAGDGILCHGCHREHGRLYN